MNTAGAPAGELNGDLVDKVLAGARVSQAEALQLYKLPLQMLGSLANHRRNLAKAAAYDWSETEKEAVCAAAALLCLR